MTDKTMIIRKIPDQLHRAFKMQAVKEGRSMASIIIEMIGAYVVAQREHG